MNKTFGYARVSTVDQNLDTQLDILTKAGCDRIFQDKVTGMSLQRPALDELLSMLREGDTVLVARFFRLGHSRDQGICCSLLHLAPGLAGVWSGTKRALCGTPTRKSPTRNFIPRCCQQVKLVGTMDRPSYCVAREKVWSFVE